MTMHPETGTRQDRLYVRRIVRAWQSVDPTMLRRQNRSQRVRHAFHWVGIAAVALAVLIGAGAVFTFLVTGALHALVWIAG